MADRNASRIVKWAELVGLMGVMGSLLFVGLEVRQNTQIARARHPFLRPPSPW